MGSAGDATMCLMQENLLQESFSLCALGLALTRPARAQFTASIKTNTISGVTSNWVSTLGYFVGSNTFKDVLLIRNGGVLTNGNGFIGYLGGATNNAAVVSGNGSVWITRTNLAIGAFSSGNSLVISNQGKVVTGDGLVLNGDAFIGDESSSSNNTVLVTDNGSVWSNQTFTFVGRFGSGNSLVISNQGRVVNDQGEVGSDAGSSNNSALVTGAGSVWDNRDNLIVGGEGIGDTLTIAGGSVLASLAVIGDASSASNNVIQVNSGSLFVTNAAGNGTLYVSAAGGKASLIINGGSVTVDTLMATNDTNSVISLNGDAPRRQLRLHRQRPGLHRGWHLHFQCRDNHSTSARIDQRAVQRNAFSRRSDSGNRHSGEQRPAVCGR